MVYVLKGWIKTNSTGRAPSRCAPEAAGSSRRASSTKVLDYSDDCEVLEIILPADFKTVELE